MVAKPTKPSRSTQHYLGYNGALGSYQRRSKWSAIDILYRCPFMSQSPNYEFQEWWNKLKESQPLHRAPPHLLRETLISSQLRYGAPILSPFFLLLLRHGCQLYILERIGISLEVPATSPSTILKLQQLHHSISYLCCLPPPPLHRHQYTSANSPPDN